MSTKMLRRKPVLCLIEHQNFSGKNVAIRMCNENTMHKTLKPEQMSTSSVVHLKAHILVLFVFVPILIAPRNKYIQRTFILIEFQ